MKAKQLFVVNMVMLAMAMSVTSCVRDFSSLSAEKVVTEKRNVSGFEQIEINGSPVVYYTQGDHFSVKVKGPEDQLKDIITECEGKTLLIRNRGKVGVFNVSFGDAQDVSVHVVSPDLTSVRLNGSGDFTSEKKIDSDQMNIVLRGSGDINIQDLICDQCSVELIGSGDVALKRVEAKDVSAMLIGSGDIDLVLRNVIDTRLSLKGSGDIDADFREGCRSVECVLQGSGDIDLKGKIEHFSKQKNGSGDIDFAKLTIEK